MIVSDKELAEHDARIEAMSSSHCELQKFHYQALNNPNYIIECLPCVLREQIQMPEPPEPVPVVERKIIYEHTSLLPRERYELNQAILKIGYLEKKVFNLTTVGKGKPSHKIPYQKYSNSLMEGRGRESASQQI